MRGFHLLVELARRATDECQGSLAHISRAKADADAALTLHEERIARESRIATDDLAIIGSLDAWSNHTAQTRALLRKRQAELDRSESAARDALRSAFADLKRLETARDTATRLERIAALRRADGEAEEQYASARSVAAL
jgi:hypothetical protein